MSKQVVHVHALGPAFLVTNLGLVLQVDKHLGLTGQDVEQAAAVRCWNFLGWPESNVGLKKIGKNILGRIPFSVSEENT